MHEMGFTLGGSSQVSYVVSNHHLQAMKRPGGSGTTPARGLTKHGYSPHILPGMILQAQYVIQEVQVLKHGGTVDSVGKSGLVISFRLVGLSQDLYDGLYKNIPGGFLDFIPSTVSTYLEIIQLLTGLYNISQVGLEILVPSTVVIYVYLEIQSPSANHQQLAVLYLNSL